MTRFGWTVDVSLVACPDLLTFCLNGLSAYPSVWNMSGTDLCRIEQSQT